MSDAQTDRAALVRNLFTHLTKGGVKMIPVVGEVLEEVIFGTLEDKERGEQAAKVNRALVTLVDGHQAESITLAEVQEQVKLQAGISELLVQKLDELLAAANSPNLAISPSLEQAIVEVMKRVPSPLDSSHGNTGGVTRDSTETTPRLNQPTKPITRIQTIKWLTSLHADKVDTLIAALEANENIPERDSKEARVARFIYFCDKGVGLPALIEVASELGMFPQ